MYFLYILKSRKHKRTYIGITSDTNKRLTEHNGCGVRSTKAYAPFDLVYTEEFENMTEARKREVRLKSPSQTKEELFRKLGLW